MRSQRSAGFAPPAFRLRAGGAKRPAQRQEQLLQQALISFHVAAVVNPPDAILFAVPNGEQRNRHTAGKLSGITVEHRRLLSEAQAMLPFGLGVLPGVVDLILLTKGAHTTLIELKACNAQTERMGTLSLEQKRFRFAVQALGHDWRLLTGVEAYEAVLRERGVALRVFLPTPGIVTR